MYSIFAIWTPMSILNQVKAIPMMKWRIFDLTTYTPSFKIRVRRVPLPPLSYPKTRQLFHDLDLQVENPRHSSFPGWNTAPTLKCVLEPPKMFAYVLSGASMHPTRERLFNSIRSRETTLATSLRSQTDEWTQIIDLLSVQYTGWIDLRHRPRISSRCHSTYIRFSFLSFIRRFSPRKVESTNRSVSSWRMEHSPRFIMKLLMRDMWIRPSIRNEWRTKAIAIRYWRKKFSLWREEWLSIPNTMRISSIMNW